VIAWLGFESLPHRQRCFIAVFVAIAPQPAVAQEDTILLGIELSLGMDKSTVLGELRRLYTVNAEPSDLIGSPSSFGAVSIQVE